MSWDAGAYIDLEAATRIKKDLYVDDGLTGGATSQVASMVGEKLDDGKYRGTLQQILSSCNFNIKAMTVSGVENVEDSNLMSNKVLGYNYDHVEDMLGLSFKMNISPMKHSIRSEPDLTVEDVQKLRSV